MHIMHVPPREVYKSIATPEIIASDAVATGMCTCTMRLFSKPKSVYAYIIISAWINFNQLIKTFGNSCGGRIMSNDSLKEGLINKGSTPRPC